MIISTLLTIRVRSFCDRQVDLDFTSKFGLNPLAAARLEYPGIANASVELKIVTTGR